ncbi:hypothetical protein [Pedobacter punctiformis]|uniref:Lipoprotein n=1 Tax=Pedobacter punctiformis TaxID=3004097 RepID=A0ABT4L889_9SPHI|nr:hypothetical protein [Pedobacter sp. HCMS5-2]MCZ4244131.1 hypothetical protein [Pedobacter sp. HCMS5-2]
MKQIKLIITITGSILGILILSVLFTNCNTHKQTKGINFKEIAFEYENQNKWVSTVTEAKQLLLLDSLSVTTEQLDSMYNKKAQYIFVIGGGCFSAKPGEMEAKIQNDTLEIIWNEPSGMCPETGKMAPANMCLEIEKEKYPRYKDFKIKKSVK